MRGLLRAFLSPAVADRYTSALQPIAVADRDAALAGAVSTLRARFYVPPEEIAVVLVEDAGWSVADVSTMLGMPLPAVRAALRTAVTEEPRVGGAAPPEDDGVDDEAAAVEAMLGGLPRHRRDAGRAAEEDAGDEPVDVELATTLPAAFGRAELAARTARADRLQRRVVNGIIIGLVVAVGLVLATTTAPPAELTDEDEVTVEPSPTPTPSATPTTDGTTDDGTDGTDGTTDDGSTDAPGSGGDSAAVPVGDPVLAEVRFVASVDPTTGTPGPALDPATTDDDPRLWLRFSQLPADDPVILLTFTAPSGRSTVRPVLLSERTPLAAVRLPDELGRAPGRYAVVVEAEGLPPVVEELDLVAAPSDDEA